jgi:glycyl-tRNA synthetase beta chain
MLQPLLIEIGVEELPAIPLLKELPNISKKWSKILEEHALLSNFEFYYTPRRLVLWHAEFQVKQDDKIQELFGAPVDIAFKDGEPTPAALGFAKKCGVSIDALDRSQKGGKEVLYFKQTIEGKESASLIPGMIEQFINALSFGKSMRWGSNSESFIRPIRWLGINFGHKLIPMSYLNVDSANQTYVHRQSSFDPQSYSDPKAYFDILKEGKVDLFDSSRRKSILDQFELLEADQNIKIEIDEDLLNEVVAITEHPVSLLGTFSEAFLELPKEVIITSMREHQRYFPVFKDGKLSNHFIVVSNAVTDDYSLIVSGNEKVLHARLADGLFFYHNDLKRGLINDGLEKVVYMNGLGNLSEKLQRESAIAQNLFEQHKQAVLSNLNKDEATVNALIKRLFEVSKADLMSEMVYEFTELQGVVGYYYASKLGEDDLVALAIKEQYLPDGEDADLPSNHLSSLIACAVKLDALMGLFSIEQIPTGSRDPFALRRAATGIIRIAIENNINLNLSQILNDNQSLYADYDIKALESFFLERLYPFYDTNPSIIKSVIASGERDIVELDKKITAVDTVAAASDFKELMSLFKRVANIIKDMTPSSDNKIDLKLFVEDAEKELYSVFTAVNEKSYASYEEQLDALFGLAPQLANFFDNVMVNADDQSLKNNRKNLIAQIYLSFKAIADIKEITL